MRFLALLIGFLALTGTLRAEHRIFEQDGSFLFSKNKLNVFFFRENTHRLVVRDEGSLQSPQYGSLDRAMKKSPCVAGVNGGFFGADVHGAPLGMVVQDGIRLYPLAAGSFAVSGIIYANRKNEITLVRSRTLAEKNSSLPAMTAALQGGPFLVEHGKIVKGLNNEKSTTRTFIATDGKKGWCLGISSSLTLKELAQWLAKPGALGDFKVQTALNLDGGSSTAFWCHETGVYYPSFKPVRNYLGVAPLAH